MPRADRPAIDRILADLLEAERNVRRLRATLLTSQEEPLLDALSEAVRTAAERAASEHDHDHDHDHQHGHDHDHDHDHHHEHDDDQDTGAELVSLALTLRKVPGPRTVDILISVLESEVPEARFAAGAALQEIAFDRFKEVALGVERALDNLPPSSPALRELPYLLSEVPEPGVAKLIGRFLAHRDAEVVAAAIEAAVELGDPSLAKHLGRLEKDKRLVELTEEDDDGDDSPDAGTTPTKITIGELAAEAIGLLEERGNGADGE